MDKIVDLINLLQIARVQPQYGYSIAGGNMRLGNLAEHHYLVTLIGWQLSELVNKQGAKIDANKVMKFCLLHDIGELFGGDIGMYYAKANPTARTAAKKFEEENQKFISSYFANSSEVLAMAGEILESESDEAHIAKIADYLECTHYKLFNDQFKSKDASLIGPKLAEKVAKIKDAVARKELTAFVTAWSKKMSKYDSFLDASTEALKV